MTILVVDDDPVICNLMALSLEQEGFCVLTAANGWEALTRWQSHSAQIDLLITDMRMSGIDGLLLARCLVLDDPGLSLLFISGEDDPSELDEFKNSGFLAKPFSPSRLLTEVDLLNLSPSSFVSEVDREPVVRGIRVENSTHLPVGKFPHRLGYLPAKELLGKEGNASTITHAYIH